jgi:hypothetical protein
MLKAIHNARVLKEFRDIEPRGSVRQSLTVVKFAKTFPILGTGFPMQERRLCDFVEGWCHPRRHGRKSSEPSTSPLRQPLRGVMAPRRERLSAGAPPERGEGTLLICY